MAAAAVRRLALLGAAPLPTLRLAEALQAALQPAGRWQVALAGGAPPPSALALGADLRLLAALQGGASAAEEAAEQSIRAALAGAGLDYQVLHGAPDERLARALEAIAHLGTPPEPRPEAEGAAVPASAPAGTRPWVWMCDKCSDPQCEHRLLTDLLAGRA